MPRDDFHFLSGHFRVRHQRLTERLAACEEWLALDTELWGYPVMAGGAFIDEMRGVFENREFWGMTLRVFDPDADEWALYWADTWHPGLCPPVRGRFEGARGVFFGEDVEQGQPVSVRFTWSNTDGPIPRWEQAFSADGGGTWETNWIMEFERVVDSSQPSPPRAW